MGSPRFSTKLDRVCCQSDNVIRQLAYLSSISFPVFARTAAMIIAAASMGCANQLALLPTADHERAEFNASQLAEQLFADAPDSWLKSPLTRSFSTLSQSGELADGASQMAGKTYRPGRDESLWNHTDKQLLSTPESLAGQSNSNQELLSIDAIAAPAESLLFALAGNAALELEINGDLTKLITIKLANKPIGYLLDKLSAQAAFAWQIEHNKLRVWSGDAYIHSYAIDYLNIDRRTQSSVGLATQVGTINAADSTASIANSSETRVENVSEHHFWYSLQTDLEGLIAHDYASEHSDVQEAQRGSPRFSINREAGLLTLFASPVVHQALQRYLRKLHDTAQRQVLIEATVVEVALSDSFEAGVDWQVLAQGINGFSAAQILVGSPAVNSDTVDRLTAPNGLLSLVQQGSNGDVQATLSLLERFGDVRILSRPRIIALNNQSSVLKVVDNRVYFTVNVERRQTDTKDEIITETEIHTVPVGLVMNVTPQISRNGAVMLNVRPTLSRILGFVNDPNPELAQANVRNSVPEIQVREMESMLQVQSGNVAIIGGLMQDTTEGDDARLPGLGQLPVIKHLFSQRSRKRRQTELLIVLRPTVLQQSLMASVQ
ncbi:MAG: pilus (MSHA type) biogenesis protein MshL [Granulosicoccus sp.]